MPQHFLAHVSKHAQRCLIDIDDLFVRNVKDGDGVNAGLECNAVVLFAQPQRFLGCGQLRLNDLLGIDILGQGDHVKHVPLVVPLWPGRHSDPSQAAVLAHQALFKMDMIDFALCQPHANRLVYGAISRMRHLLNGQAGNLLQRVTGDLDETRIAPQILALK